MAGYTDASKHALALRTIVVSGRAAMLHATTPESEERIKDRVTQLLAELEEAVIRDGADPELLPSLDEARREVWE